MIRTIAPADALTTIRTVSDLTENTFLEAGQALEASIEILAKLASGCEAALVTLDGHSLVDALQALSRTADRAGELGADQTNDSVGFLRMKSLTEAIGARIVQMKTSLKDVEALALNSRIAAAHLTGHGDEFTSFAEQIGNTLNITKAALDCFAAELLAVNQEVASAYSGQLAFEIFRREAAASITGRLNATVKAIAHQHQQAARSGRDAKLRSARAQQRICKAILSLQIGDITRQRLEHVERALQLVSGTLVQSGSPHDTAHASLDAEESRTLSLAIHRLQSTQLCDTARGFEREVGRIIGSLNSLAAEARALRSIGSEAYGASDHEGGGFIGQLEAQVREALVLFDSFETAQSGGAQIRANVSRATGILCQHLDNVLMLETDIRIMGLNTTFKCARIGREGLALSLIAQELRTYANGFAGEAGSLKLEVGHVAGIADGMKSANRMGQITEDSHTIRSALATLQEVGRILDDALTDLGNDSDLVVARLLDAVTELAARNEIGGVLRQIAAHLIKRPPSGHLDVANLPPAVGQILDSLATEYTMAIERSVHSRFLGRSCPTATDAVAALAETEDLLF